MNDLIDRQAAVDLVTDMEFMNDTAKGILRDRLRKLPSVQDDLISRQAVIDRINKQREHLRPDIFSQDKIGDAAYRICAEFIERIPSAQPERKKGKWIYHRDWAEEGSCGYECSVCGMGSDVDYDYCMRCGAEMRGDKT